MNPPILYNYFRSSTSYRVRTALAVKGIGYEYAAKHLRKNEQRQSDYLAINPQGLVPTLVWPEIGTFTQSLAILEYLEEAFPTPPLLPADPVGRARVRSIAHAIALDIHPINNLRVLNYLRQHFSADDAAVADWFRHWVAETFGAIEARLSTEPETGRFCHGDNLTIADLCLVAQISNNQRFNVDMTAYPTIARIGAAIAEIPAVRGAAPDNQPDRE